MLLVDKQKVIGAYFDYLYKKIKSTENVLESLYRGIDSAPGPSQSHSDTTRFQQSRIAIETEKRLSSLKKMRASATTISPTKSSSPEIGALIVIKDNDSEEEEYCFVVSEGGGESLIVGETEILFVSIQAPILEAISKATLGDSFEFRGRGLTLVKIL